MKGRNKSKPDLTREDVLSILKEEMPHLRRKYGVQRMLLYGAFAKGKPTDKSDVDILVALRKDLGFAFIELADRLEELLGRRVDITTCSHFESSSRNQRYRHIAEDIRQSMIHV